VAQGVTCCCRHGWPVRSVRRRQLGSPPLSRLSAAGRQQSRSWRRQQSGCLTMHACMMGSTQTCVRSTGCAALAHAPHCVLIQSYICPPVVMLPCVGRRTRLVVMRPRCASCSRWWLRRSASCPPSRHLPQRSGPPCWHSTQSLRHSWQQSARHMQVCQAPCRTLASPPALLFMVLFR
jgi:hypothetical protein